MQPAVFYSHPFPAVPCGAPERLALSNDALSLMCTKQNGFLAMVATAPGREGMAMWAMWEQYVV